MIHIDLKFFRNLGDLRSCGIRQSDPASFLGLADLMHIAVVGPEYPYHLLHLLFADFLGSSAHF